MATGVSPLDVWSIAHLLSGAALAIVGLNTRWSLVVLTGFEFVEAGLRLVPSGNGPLFEYESFANIVADVFIGLIGYLGAEALFRRFEWRRVWHLLPDWIKP